MRDFVCAAEGVIAVGIDRAIGLGSRMRGEQASARIVGERTDDAPGRRDGLHEVGGRTARALVGEDGLSALKVEDTDSIKLVEQGIQ